MAKLYFRYGAMNCGKTTSTVEYYTMNCGRNPGQIIVY